MEAIKLIFEAIDQYRHDINAILIAPVTFISFSLIVICVMIIRFIMLYKAENAKSKIKRITKDQTYYLAGHVLIETLITFVIGYFIIKLTFADPRSYIINYIFAPGIGFTLALVIDGILINKYGTTVVNRKKSDKKEKGDGNHSIVINVDNGAPKEIDPDKKPAKPIGVIEKTQENFNSALYLNAAEIADEDFDETVIGAINDMRKTQALHTSQIANNTETLNSIAQMVDIIRETEMNDKKLELKSLIYDCLDQGYATPEQNDKITTQYKSYSALNGNGEIKVLFENHYSKLSIHWDRRVNNSDNYTGEEKRNKNRSNCQYGTYDNEPHE